MIDQSLLKSLALRPGPSGRYLVRAVSGEVFIPLADTAWELFHRLTKDEAVTYLDTRRRQGFNAVFSVLLPELDVKPADGKLLGPDGIIEVDVENSPGSKMFYPNREGEIPLHDDNPSSPNQAYFSHVDWVIQEAAKRSITVFIVPTWSRHLNGGWAGGPVIFDLESAKTFGAFVGARYPFLPKILGGDSNPQWTNAKLIWGRYTEGGRQPLDEPLPDSSDLPHIDSFDIVDAMAAGFTEAEQPLWGGLGKPLLTYHPTALWLPWSRKATASSFFGDRDWLTLDGCQSGHADFPNLPFHPPLHFWNSRASHEPITEMRNQSPVRPVIDLESHYEDLHNALDARTGWKWGEHDIRSGAWQSMLSGACGVVYGTNAIWQMYDADDSHDRRYVRAVCGLDKDSSWRKAIHLPGPKYLPILQRFFQTLPPATLHSLHPSQDLLVSSDAPEEKQQLDGRIDVMCDDDSTVLIAHSGMGYAFDLDITKAFPGQRSLQMKWLDPRTGEMSECRESGNEKFVPPSSGSVAEDWVLVIRSP